MALFDKRPYSTEFEAIDFIHRVWPTTKMPSVFVSFSNKTSEATFDNDLFNAIVRNNDWDNRKTLEAVGYLTCSQRHVFRFLGKSPASPLTQSPDVQTDLAAAINDHLRHDGYRLIAVRRLSGSPVYEVQSAALEVLRMARSLRRSPTSTPTTVRQMGSSAGPSRYRS